MNTRRACRLGLCLALLTSLAGCGRGDDPPVRQTKFPGQVSAGGGTSGEVMARAGGVANTPDSSGTPGIPQGSGGNVGGAAMGGTSTAAGTAGQAPAAAPSGTPGIPEGAGGNPSGAAMGGTTEQAAASKNAPGPQSTVPGKPEPAGKQ